jgi:hypothetical protein
MKRLKYMTPLRCLCGARGDMIWSEDETGQAVHTENYQIVSVTELFAVKGDDVVCRLCDRVLPCVGAVRGEAPAKPDKPLQSGSTAN